MNNNSSSHNNINNNNNNNSDSYINIKKMTDELQPLQPTTTKLDLLCLFV